MAEEKDNSSFHCVDAVVYDSKKKKNPGIDMPQEQIEDDLKGKKVVPAP